MKYLKLRWLLLAAVLSLFAGTRPVAAQQDFYAGKTIEIIIPLAAGGQLDIAGRVLASYLARYVDGAPKVQVVNLTGGGGPLELEGIISMMSELISFAAAPVVVSARADSSIAVRSFNTNSGMLRGSQKCRRAA